MPLWQLIYSPPERQVQQIQYLKKMLTFQIFDDFLHLLLVERLAPFDEGDIQPLVDLFKLFPGDVTDEVPALDVLLVEALQLDHRLVRPFLKLGVFVKPLLRVLVERHQVRDGR